MSERADEMRLNLYRNSAGAWVVFTSAPATYTTADRKRMEAWITARGLQPKELEQLFRHAEENGEGIITVSLLRKRHPAS
jgi:hypothetical protein